MKKNFKNVLLFILIPVALVLALAIFTMGKHNSVEKSHSEIVQMIYNNEISDFELNLYSGQLTYTLRADGNKYKTTVASSEIFYNDVREFLIENAQNSTESNNKITYNYDSGGEASWIAGILPSVILCLLFVGLMVFFMRRMGGMGGGDKTLSFGKAKVKKLSDDKRKTTFTDVAGADEEKEEMQELVEFLKNPKKFNELGARIPKGVLLVGPPGTGKTLLARAVAGEAEVAITAADAIASQKVIEAAYASNANKKYEVL